MLAPSLSTQLATPLAVRVLELSQSDLDASFKVKGKKGEEFKVVFLFVSSLNISPSFIVGDNVFPSYYRCYLSLFARHPAVSPWQLALR